jgi:hypothetical protein
VRVGRAILLGAGLLGAGLLGAGLPRARADFGPDEQKFSNDAYPVEFRQRVNAAVDRATHWLLLHQSPDGSWAGRDRSTPLGVTALCTLACLKGGVPGDHPRMEKAFAFMRGQPLNHTYSVSILLMALDAKYDAGTDAFETEKVDRYGNRIVPTPCTDKISKEDLEWMKEGVKFLLQYQGVGSPVDGGNGQGPQGEGRPGAWRYPGGGFDLSNTQYALLGLKAATRCGLKIPSEAWVESLKFLLDWQEKDGPEVKVRGNEVRGDYRVEWTENAKARGFRYALGKGDETRPPTGSMTTAGLAGLMICQSELWRTRRFSGELREKTRIGIRDGLAWLQAHFTVTRNPSEDADGRNPWHFYYLYGLERMGILGHLRYVGKEDWYEDGALYLLEAQNPEGSWRDDDMIDTCFALLFLKRASFHLSNPVITPSEKAPEPTDK